MNQNLINKNPLISVIINCYNGEKYLKEAINSVLKQTYKNWEIIFWDNQSSDKTASILKSYKDKRIKYYYAKTHTTLYEARNQAYLKSKGEFLCFLDSDDYYLNNFIKKQLQLFENSDVGFSSVNHFYKDEKKKIFWVRFKKKMPEGFILDDLLQDYSVCLSSLFIRRSVLPQLKAPFDNNYTYIGDFDLVIRLSAEFKMARSHEPLNVHRLHDNNLSIKNYSIQLKELDNWYNKVKKIKKIKNSINFSNIQKLINYKKIIIALHENKINIVMSLLKKQPWSLRKIRYIIILILVRGFGFGLKNFRL